jgi:hypothetical protein
MEERQEMSVLICRLDYRLILNRPYSATVQPHPPEAKGGGSPPYQAPIY